MDASFIPIEVVPTKTPFELDQLRRSYKSALSATAAIAAAPAVGTADETFPNMFLTPITTPESAQAATRIDLLYQGMMNGAGGSPSLPAQKHDSDTAVQSATSSYGSAGPSSLPFTVQFYAPTTTLSYISYGAAGTVLPADPTGTPVVITMALGPTNTTPQTLSYWLTTFFSINIIATIQAVEIVPGKYWQNVAKKTLLYVPYLVNVAPGSAVITIASAGTGYVNHDSVTISASGQTASLEITAIGAAGNIAAWSVTTSTFTLAASNVAAIGGHGSGGAFNVVLL